MGQINYAIRVKSLTFGYSEKTVLDNLEINIEANKLNFILGRNGSGKSTFLKIIAGVLPAQNASIQIFGNDFKTTSITERAKLIGYLGQHHKAVFPFGVEDVVLTGRAGYVKLMPGKLDKTIAQEALVKAGILHLKDKNYMELSGGEQQLVMIARVLAQQPKIILLDEPTTHLDFCHLTNLMKLLRNLTKEGITIVAVIHDPNLALLMGDEFLYMNNKKLFKTEKSENIWETGVLESIYSDNLERVPYKDKMLVMPALN